VACSPDRGVEMPDQRVLVWGAGAIGGTLGAYLARAGHDVTLVDVVEDHVAAIRGVSRPSISPTTTAPLPP
jgi:2-dehydropantoate 2-reductase